MLAHVVFDPIVLDAEEQLSMGGSKGNIERIIRSCPIVGGNWFSS